MRNKMPMPNSNLQNNMHENKILTASNAWLFPMRMLPNKADDIKFTAPVYDDKLSEISETATRRIYGEVEVRSVFETGNMSEYTRFEQGIYGGVIFNHYGHFMLESLARLWAAPCFESVPIFFHSSISQDWQWEILNFLGITRNRVIFITQSMRCSTLYIPVPGFVISSYFTNIHEQFLAKAESRPRSGQRLWLSRSTLPTSLGVIDGERQIESRLREQGWSVVHLEDVSFRDQIRYLAEAEIIGGIEGSAFHNIVFLRNPRTELRIIPRNHRAARLVKNYYIISEQKKLNQFSYDKPMELVNDAGYRSSFRIPDVEDALNFVLDRGSSIC